MLDALAEGLHRIQVRQLVPSAALVAEGIDADAFATQLRAEVVQLDGMLVFALPGSPRAAAQCLDILAPVLGHALAMADGAGHGSAA